MAGLDERFDAREFLRGLSLADARVRRGAARGMQKLALEVERQAKELAPVETGTLAGTIAAGDVKADPEKVEVEVAAGGGEAADYAVKQHEVPMHHTQPIEGVYPSKYMERPLQVVSRKAGAALAGEVRRELTG